MENEESERLRSWSEVDLKTFIGRDLQLTEEGLETRGPVKRFSIEDMPVFTVQDKQVVEGEPTKYLNLFLDWIAQLTRTGWKLKDVEQSETGIYVAGVNLKYSMLEKHEDGSYSFDVPYTGRVKIYPEGENLRKENLSFLK